MIFALCLGDWFSISGTRIMHPIYEPGRGGLEHQQFFERFKEICQEHVEKDRARAFAFIFYRFDDYDLQSILTNEEALATLNGVARNDITVFYLDTPSQAGLDFFNSTHAGRLNVQGDATPPCIVFFKMKRGHVTDVIPRHLDRADMINGLNELTEILKEYKTRELQGDVPFPEFLNSIKEMFKQFPRYGK
jgi:hypothetical protein